jgi:hypothetical protein
MSTFATYLCNQNSALVGPSPKLINSIGSSKLPSLWLLLRAWHLLSSGVIFFFLLLIFYSLTAIVIHMMHQWYWWLTSYQIVQCYILPSEILTPGHLHQQWYIIGNSESKSCFGSWALVLPPTWSDVLPHTWLKLFKQTCCSPQVKRMDNRI